jgi:hypothetical protein
MAGPEQARAALDDVQREGEAVGVCGEHEGCACAGGGPCERAGARAREEDEVEGG